VPVFYSDFMSLYHALLGWSKGASFYDFSLQHQLMLVTNPHVSLQVYPYFPYPPWYAAATFFLAWLSFEWAYRTWMILNIGMLVFSAHLLTINQPERIRLLAWIVAVLYLPSFGLLVVGNYTVPVLLGGALLIYAIQRESAFQTALGFGLLTFKPHIGFLMALACFIWLLFQRSVFAQRARWMTIVTGCVLFGIGFIVEPHWLTSFQKSIYSWQRAPYIRTNEYSAGPAHIITYLTGHQLGPIAANWISGALFLLCIFLIWFKRDHVFNNIRDIIGLMASLTVVVLPYKVNYDFVILLIPFAVVFDRYEIFRIRFLLMFIYILPWLGLVLDRTIGNFILTLTGATLFFMLLFGARTELGHFAKK
jgi:hypothetical protein